MKPDVTRELRSPRERARGVGAFRSRSLLEDRMASPRERQQRELADQRGEPYVLFRDHRGVRHLVTLAGERMVIGRSEEAAVALTWDRGVSREHACLEPSAGRWSIVDDGSSTNGTFVNEERIDGRCLLRDGDLVSVGRTTLAFRDPAHPADA